MGKGEGRNRPCRCGSGKKFKKCCLSRPKNRTVSIDIDPRNIEMMDGLGISTTGRVVGIRNGQALPLIGESAIEYGYNRKHNFKLLSKGPIATSNLYLTPDPVLLEFDHVFAVDTNTKDIGGDKVSVAAVLHCIIGPKNNTSVNISYSFLGWFEYRNIIGKEENLAWMQLSIAIAKEPGYEEQKIALLVDSDLMCHDQYNKGELPIYGNYYLPSNTTLIYASADGGKEVLINRLIGFCDSKAKELLGYLVNQEYIPDISMAKIEGQPYSHLRQWYPNEECESNKLNLSGLDDLLRPDG